MLPGRISHERTMHPLSEIPDFVKLEHETAKILQRQEAHGWRFDVAAARQLTSTLEEELQEAKQVLQNRHPFVQGPEFNPKRDNKTQGYVSGCPSTRLKSLNPTSRDHIAWVLETFYKWKPKKPYQYRNNTDICPYYSKI